MNTRDVAVPGSDANIEQRLIVLGASNYRVTPALIDSLIVSEVYHVYPGTTFTTCLLTLRNGFTVSGESACADPANFNEQIGKDIALRNAKDKIWALEGYLLRQRMHEQEQRQAAAPASYQDRVQAEHDELAGRLQKLETFINSDKAADVSPFQLALMRRQAGAMSDYLLVLAARIEDFKIGGQA